MGAAEFRRSRSTPLTELVGVKTGFPSSSPVPTFAEPPTLALTSKSEERRQGGRGSSRAAEGSAWKS